MVCSMCEEVINADNNIENPNSIIPGYEYLAHKVYCQKCSDNLIEYED